MRKKRQQNKEREAHEDITRENDRSRKQKFSKEKERKRKTQKEREAEIDKAREREPMLSPFSPPAQVLFIHEVNGPLLAPGLWRL